MIGIGHHHSARLLFGKWVKGHPLLRLQRPGHVGMIGYALLMPVYNPLSR